MNKYNEMAKEAQRLWDKAQVTENVDERAALEMKASNLWYDIENS